MRRRAAARIVGGALLTLTACGAPEPDDALTTSPRIVEFSPEHTGARIELVNRGDARVQLSQFRVDPRDPDWGSFTIEIEWMPRKRSRPSTSQDTGDLRSGAGRERRGSRRRAIAGA